MNENFYIYAHIRKTDGKCFYIGKGKKDRHKCTQNRNKYWWNIVNKHGFESLILINGINEEKAFKLEMDFIKQIGKENLVNLTDGGEGASGYYGYWNGKNRSNNTKDKISKSKQGVISHNKGKKLSEETKNKISSSLKGKRNSDNFKITETHKQILNKSKYKPVIQYDLEGNFIKEWECMKHPFEQGIVLDPNGISACCKGRQKTCGGFKWKYK
jgi:hypothetical protein